MLLGCDRIIAIEIEVRIAKPETKTRHLTSACQIGDTLAKKMAGCAFFALFYWNAMPEFVSVFCPVQVVVG